MGNCSSQMPRSPRHTFPRTVGWVTVRGRGAACRDLAEGKVSTDWVKEVALCFGGRARTRMSFLPEALSIYTISSLSLPTAVPQGVVGGKFELPPTSFTTTREIKAERTCQHIPAVAAETRAGRLGRTERFQVYRGQLRCGGQRRVPPFGSAGGGKEWHLSA